ncbi:cytochrome c oxidase assembly protein [Saccharopolyspora rosea]|uniref:Cytochrome c oxidase assembly protein n=1 Tax=Saccharopolyspora rosea TaxID=524884 RepID=A0ABW3FLT0_9PSEU|nr:cytochrome c oxidase assembly protein [Saccharopolyspora rosea]
MHTPPPLTWATGLSSWQLSIWDVVVLVLAAGYLRGLAAHRRRGGRWPAWRTCCFFGGLAALVLSVNSSIGVYSGVLFSVHMAQHLTLIMAVPVLLTFGRPLSLWTAAAPTPDKTERRERFLLSRPVTVLTHPALAFVFYAVVLIGTHLTSFLQARLENPALQHVEIALYLVSGYLFFLSLIGGEPVRWRRVPHPLRVVLLMAGMLPDTLVGVVLMIAPRPLAPGFDQAHPGWGPTALVDQHLSGAIMWFFGDATMAALAAFTVGLWVRASGADAGLGSWLESARRNTLTRAEGDDAAAAASESVDVDSDENALAAYNAMLARLHQASRQPRSEQDQHRPPG